MQPYFIHLTGSMCISTLWKSSRHPCRVVTSIGINWAWGALVFRVSEKESKLANNLHFYLQPDLWEKSLGWSVLKQVSEENWHSLAWGEETPPTKPRQVSVLRPCSFQFCNAMGWTGTAFNNHFASYNNSAMYELEKSQAPAVYHCFLFGGGAGGLADKLHF